MITQISGKLVEKTPSHVIIDCGGIGYFINISLSSFSKIHDDKNCCLYTHLSVMQNMHSGETIQSLYGFADKSERQLFSHLITVSGISSNKAIAVLSSLSPEKLHQAIIDKDLSLLKTVKGIGEKQAEKIIVELRDKIVKDELFPVYNAQPLKSDNNIKDDALSALIMLGFAKNIAEKAVNQALRNGGKDLSVDQLVKATLKNL